MLILELDGSLIRSEDPLSEGLTTAPVPGRSVLLRSGTTLLAQVRTYVMTIFGGNRAVAPHGALPSAGAWSASRYGPPQLGTG